MIARFYVKFENKLKYIHQAIVPDNATEWSLLGMAVAIGESSLLDVGGENQKVTQAFTFKRVTGELADMDGGMFLFDADKLLK